MLPATDPLNAHFKVLKLYQQPPRIDARDAVHSFPGQAPLHLYSSDDGEPDWLALAHHYGIPEHQRHLREKIAVWTRPDPGAETMVLEWLTIFDVLHFKGRNCPFQYGSALCVTKTADGQIVLGVRGGEATPRNVEKYASGLLGTAPAGLLTFTKAADPFEKTALREFEEELGSFEANYHGVLGLFEAYQPGPRGLKFLCELSTTATLAELQASHIVSRDYHYEAQSSGLSRGEIERKLRARALPVDAWEHSVLLGVAGDLRSLEALVRARACSFGAAVGSGPLMTYVLAKRLAAG